MPHSKKKLIHDALRVCEELKTFISNKTLKDLENDRGLQLIIEREFEILGESLYRLRNVDEETFLKITNGQRIIGARNVIAHGYDVVEYVILWDAITQDFSLLEAELLSLV